VDRWTDRCRQVRYLQPPRTRDEAQRVQAKLELGAGADEGRAHLLVKAVPAELQPQHVGVGVPLGRGGSGIRPPAPLGSGCSRAGNSSKAHLHTKPGILTSSPGTDPEQLSAGLRGGQTESPDLKSPACDLGAPFARCIAFSGPSHPASIPGSTQGGRGDVVG